MAASGHGAIGRRALALAGAVAPAAVPRAQPASWAPDRPVRLTVPFPPGALTDVLGRMVADSLQRTLGQPVVVENRPGGSTLVGAAAVARQPADGHHLLMATIARREGLEPLHVPYQGSQAALADVVAGRVRMMWLDAAVAVPQAAAGAVRALAVTGAGRRPSHPDLPSVAEIWPEVTMTAWQAVVTPAGTPETAIARLNAEVNRLAESEEGRRQLDVLGVEARPMTPAALRDMIRADAARWAGLVRAAGLAPS